MTTALDTRALVDNAADTIAKAWIKDAFRTMGTVDFYLWYRTRREGEKMAMPIHSVDQPNDEYKRDIQISNGWTVEQARRKIADRLNVLPLF